MNLQELTNNFFIEASNPLMGKIFSSDKRFCVLSLSMESFAELFFSNKNNQIYPINLQKETFPELFQIFNDEEIQKANGFKTYKRQKEWMCGRYIIKQLVSKIYSVEMKHIQVSTKVNGAPYLKDFPEKNISISHSGKYAIGAITLSRETQIGIDIENITQPRSNEFCSIAFSQNELNYLKTQPFQQLYVNWTIKESYLKLIEQGFHENLKQVEVLDNKIYHHGKLMETSIITAKMDSEYIFSVVSN